MYVSLKNLADSSRIWIYQSNRAFNEKEIYTLEIGLREFVENWTAHNKELQASFEVKRGFFIILAVDESSADASGCSIDRSVNFMKVIEKEFSVDLFNRMNFTYLQDDQTKIATKTEFGQLLSKKQITDETLVYNNLVPTLGDYRKKWLQPFGLSWHKNLFANSI